MRIVPDVDMPLPRKEDVIREAAVKPEKAEAILKHQTRMK